MLAAVEIDELDAVPPAVELNTRSRLPVLGVASRPENVPAALAGRLTVKVELVAAELVIVPPPPRLLTDWLSALRSKVPPLTVNPPNPSCPAPANWRRPVLTVVLPW